MGKYNLPEYSGEFHESKRNWVTMNRFDLHPDPVISKLGKDLVKACDIIHQLRKSNDRLTGKDTAQKTDHKAD